MLGVLRQDLNHLAHKENTQSEIFLLGRLKILITFCSVTSLTYCKIPSHMVEILTLLSTHKQLKNLGALFELLNEAKVRQKRLNPYPISWIQ